MQHKLAALAIVMMTTPAFAARDIDGDSGGGALSDVLDVKPKPRFNLDPEAVAREEAERQQDPLKFITGDMSEVTGDLSQMQTGKPVQDKQGRIVSQLDAIIRELEKQCQGGGSGSGGSNNPSRPMADSKLAGGPGGMGDLHAPKSGKKEWTRIPPKEREAILQSRNEGFPAGYEDLLRSYYLRLAEERVSKDDAATTQPAAQ